jgi:uncharacterized protein YdhG (YjbR/CyaY superfamily)
MKSDQKSPSTIDEYIAGYPADVQQILQKIRSIIREVVPEAQEAIKYQMPTFTLKGNLVSYGAYKNHIGLYPAPEGDEKFNKELSVYKTEKSTVRFPLDQPVPYDLIRQILTYLVEANLKRAASKARSRR